MTIGPCGKKKRSFELTESRAPTLPRGAWCGGAARVRCSASLHSERKKLHAQRKGRGGVSEADSAALRRWGRCVRECVRACVRACLCVSVFLFVFVYLFVCLFVCVCMSVYQCVSEC